MATLRFLGGAKTVTGSCYYLEVGGLKILVDCGMFQGKKELRMKNYRTFYFKPQEVDYILLTHAHIDHSGLIPRLYKLGFRGEVVATKATVDLCKIMLPDSGHIQEMESEWKSRKAKRKGEKPIEPLYTALEAEECLKVFRSVAYLEKVKLNDFVTLRFRDAGHILGSAIIEIWVEEAGKDIKLVFSGDLGQNNTPILKDPEIVDQADYLIIESTYGNRIHEDKDNSRVKLKEIIEATVKRGGNIVIPSFAVGRTQTILYDLNRLIEHREIPPIPVYIDSPLAVSATEIFIDNPQCYDGETAALLKAGDDPFEFSGLTFTRSTEESKEINNIQGSKLIISASGMCDAGRIKHHLKHNLWRPDSSVIFVGYQAEGTLGRSILEGAKKVKLFGEVINVAAQIHEIRGFSAHADRDGLLDWIEKIKEKPMKIFVVHGEEDATLNFAQLIKEKTGIDAIAPDIGDSYTLTAGGIEHITRAEQIYFRPLSASSLETKDKALYSIFALEKKLLEIKESLLFHEDDEIDVSQIIKVLDEVDVKINEIDRVVRDF
jgi:metallo-beta-lactamase family protein